MLSVPLNYGTPNVPSHISQMFRQFPYQLKVVGTADVQVTPDMASVSLGVSTENQELKLAQEQNTQIVNRVIQGLIGAGIPQKDIQTQSYTIDPQYDYVEGRQIFRNYRVVHMLLVTIRNIDRIGTVIDGAVANGANIINNIVFSTADPSRYYKQALTLAINDAINKASVIGQSIRAIVSKMPVHVVEESSQPIPFEDRQLLKAAEGITPIQPGQINISARVVATFTYRPLPH
ncbi:hypothetical protein HNQ80_002327 [Anaerosolibacter carboniphilus]|uniref:DUF541 domain-containing protein n=1 Tax=Anaerosolibacter carboniphilus TaxID=1417629 RepID=A0A841KVI5_9FIRM|nr:SIMPL domain-containing protein [Anaerosolibacter carboniphilus]MBB6216228.1 hypothetical protein [Anaerosolibacter carboniphilus]